MTTLRSHRIWIYPKTQQVFQNNYLFSQTANGDGWVREKEVLNGWVRVKN